MWRSPKASCCCTKAKVKNKKQSSEIRSRVPSDSSKLTLGNSALPTFSELQLKSTQIQRGKHQMVGEKRRILERLILLKHERSPPFRDDSLRSHWKVLKDLLWSRCLPCCQRKLNVYLKTSFNFLMTT